MTYSWVRDVLMRDPNWRGGIDLNQDGVIRPEEQVQNYNRNGLVGDSGDWELFAANNAEALRKQVAFFGWSAPFKRDNPINELLAIESEMVALGSLQREDLSLYELLAESQSVNAKDIKEAYAFVEKVLKIVQERLSDGRDRTNPEKIQLIYQVMQDLGVQFSTGLGLFTIRGDGLFAITIKKNKVLDCDTSSFVALAVAHEMDWPLFLVLAPRHAFVRWEGEGERFNVDEGEIYPDSFYIDWLKISQENIEAGVYLASLSHSQTLALFFYDRGVAKIGLHRFEEAVEDFETALRIDPNFVQAKLGLKKLQARLNP